MAYAQATEVDVNAIPVIDLAPLIDGSQPLAVAQEIHRACTEVGFLYVKNHGLDPQLVEQLHQAGLGFFRQSEAQKRRVLLNETHRGFLAYGNAKMSDDAKPDLKESFVWGTDASEEAIAADPKNRFLGRNLWPESPELEPLCLAYTEQVHGLAKHLLHAFALGMGVPADTFLAGSDAPISRTSMVYYPPQPKDMGSEQFGVAPHTDFGVLTLLRQDDVGGLQVQGLDGQWLTAKPIEDTLIINVGDLLERWSNGHYRSTPHRVVNASGRERLSLVVAYDPAYDTPIDASVALEPGEALKSDPIRCGDYLTWRFEKAFG